MLYIIEGLGFAVLCYYIVKYESIKAAIGIALFIFIVAIISDAFTYHFWQSIGIPTPHNFIWNLIVNGIALIGSLSGVVYGAKKN